MEEWYEGEGKGKIEVPAGQASSGGNTFSAK